MFFTLSLFSIFFINYFKGKGTIKFSSEEVYILVTIKFSNVNYKFLY